MRAWQPVLADRFLQSVTSKGEDNMASDVRLPNVSVANVSRHGSSLPGHSNGLDAERAASMADEGGASGAAADALEQAGGTVREALVQLRRTRDSRPRWLPWLLAAGGFGAALALWLRHRATQAEPARSLRFTARRRR
jgi:hypothetical protein